MNCRHCATPLRHIFLDLGTAPPSNNYLSVPELQAQEVYFPLRLFVCEKCWLVQTEDYSRSQELFRADYAYFSSVSKSWLEHARTYVDMIVPRLDLDRNSFVIELASNDGYLLRNFVDRKIPCIGVEPTASTAEAGEKAGVPSIREFFGEVLGKSLAESGRQADLIIGNNVYAHVPDINDFTRGLKAALKPDGTITLEFPHLLNLIKLVQFDTVYHEHFSYLSLHAVQTIFAAFGLRIYDVEEVSTHGGSLRIFGCHTECPQPTQVAVTRILYAERDAGLLDIGSYGQFQHRADEAKNNLLHFLLEQKRAGKTVLGYGAAAKGVTLLNYAGVRPDLLPFVSDAAASKQGKYLPGCRIPIKTPADLLAQKPDFVLILPWNIAGEVCSQLSQVDEWGGAFVVAIPEIRTVT